MAKRARLALLAGMLLATASCSHNPYRYVPAENRATNTRESNEALYNLPKENPSGTLRIQYLGIEDYRIQKPGAPEVRALHLRVVASNSAATGDWSLDSRDFFVSFPDGSQAQPVGSSPPALKILPGSLLGMDLYFELPRKLKSAGEIAEFDLHWQVRALGRNFARTTPFDRVRLPPERAYAYDPFWGSGYNPYSVSIGAGYGGWWG